MLALLTLPIELMRLAFYALQGVVDALRARNRLHLKFTVLVNAPRDAVAAQHGRPHAIGWTAGHGVFARTRARQR
jgi:hypothetical protein